MGIVDLMRHGEVEGGSCFRGFTDDPLTKKGWLQMQTVSHGANPWQHIISSPLKRCSDFARHLSENFSIPMTLDDRLKEMNFGDWEGRNAKDLMQSDAQALKNFWQNPDQHTAPNGETMSTFQRRVLEAWNEIADRHFSKQILIISHGGPIRTIIGTILRIPNQTLLNIELPLASINRVRIDVNDDGTSCSNLILSGLNNLTSN
jgi:alpha-ribazole phosphatase